MKRVRMGMTLGLGLLSIAAAGCDHVGHIQLSLSLQLGDQCQPIVATDPNPPPPQSCEAMLLGCADHVQFRIRDSSSRGAGDILRSRCLDVQEFGRPRTLCDLMGLAHAVSLVQGLPPGQTVIFELRALRLRDQTAGCDGTDSNPPNPVFIGYSPPVLLDGNDHSVVIHLARCYSCAAEPLSDGGPPPPDQTISPADMGERPNFDLGSITDGGVPPSDLAAPSDLGVPADLAAPADLGSNCPSGSEESPYYQQGGARCCPSSIDRSQCLAPGARCPDGTRALLPPGGCCAICA